METSSEARLAHRGRAARPSESDVLEIVDSELERENCDATVTLKSSNERAKHLSARRNI